MTNPTSLKTPSTRKTDSLNVRNAKTAARAMIAYARRYVAQTGASQLVLTDVEKYDAPAIVADGAHGQAFAIWIAYAWGSQLIRAAGSGLDKTCRMTLDSLRGNRLEVWRVMGADLVSVVNIPAGESRERIEQIGLALDLLVAAEGRDRAATGPPSGQPSRPTTSRGDRSARTTRMATGRKRSMVDGILLARWSRWPVSIGPRRAQSWSRRGTTARRRRIPRAPRSSRPRRRSAPGAGGRRCQSRRIPRLASSGSRGGSCGR